MADRPMNWAGNVTFSAAQIHRPSSVDQVQRVVAASSHIRALGTGHSFSTVANTDGDLVSLANLPPSIELDTGRRVVTVGAGVRYGELAQQLHRDGFAVHNLGSLPHISVGGACATGTHGSGVTNGNLATAVRAVELVTASGDLATIERGSADFPGSVVALGALGVVTTLTLDVVPTFDVAQYVYDDLTLDAFLDNLDATFSAAYSVSLFTDWKQPVFNQVWVKHRIDDAHPIEAPAQWMDARLADGARHPVPGMATVNCTEQDGVPGPWHERLPHFRLEFTPSSGEELQTEYFVPRESAIDALRAVDSMRQHIAPVLQITELRTVAADDLWLSPAYGRDSVGIHFTWIKDADAVAPVVRALEGRLAPFDARPHWGKVFSTEPAVIRGLYDRLPDFSALATRIDPARKFRNEFVDRYIA